MYAVFLPLMVGAITTVWLTRGGVRDLRRLFRDRRTCERNTLDDGMVVNHHNLDEAGSNPENRTIHSLSPVVVSEEGS